MICPKCNKTYDDKINICPECGSELIEETEFTRELNDKKEDNITKIVENNKITNEKIDTISKVENFKEQWLIMKEDEENYKKFMENEDSEAFDKIVKRLVEHYKNKESAETAGWFITYEENQRKIEENTEKIDDNNKLINEKLREIRDNDEYIKSAEARIKDYKEERKRIVRRLMEIEKNS